MSLKTVTQSLIGILFLAYAGLASAALTRHTYTCEERTPNRQAPGGVAINDLNFIIELDNSASGVTVRFRRNARAVPGVADRTVAPTVEAPATITARLCGQNRAFSVTRLRDGSVRILDASGVEVPGTNMDDFDNTQMVPRGEGVPAPSGTTP